MALMGVGLKIGIFFCSGEYYFSGVMKEKYLQQVFDVSSDAGK